MKCMECGRDNLTERELEVHDRLFHKQNIMQYQQPQQIRTGTCLDCGGDLWHENGCVTCHSCGFSKCG
jgi:hypothetical protein